MTSASLNRGPPLRFVLNWQVDLDDGLAGWLPPRRWSRQVVQAALRVPSSRITGGRVLELTLRLCSNAEMQVLNRDFRQQDKATNVLSFAAEAMPECYGKRDYLGDVVLAFPYVLDEARAQGKSPRSHWAHLLTHGVLHLLGYDHMEPQAALEMERLEQELLASLGVADPYVEISVQ